MPIRKEIKFFNLFNQQCENMLKAAKFFNELVTAGNFDEDTTASMNKIEQEGDIIIREISAMLDKSFITPFDRENILELSDAIDDVIDSLNVLTKRMKIYKLHKPDVTLKHFAVFIEQSAVSLCEAIKHLDNIKTYTRVQFYCNDVNKIENLSDQIRDDAISDLFEKYSDPIYILRWKEIYEMAENTIDLCDQVAKIMYSLTVKNG